MGRITAFLAILALTFALAFAVGRLVEADPPGAQTTTTRHDGGTHA